MTLAPFILCAYWCAADPTLGAVTLEPGDVSVYAAGGIDTAFPTVSLGGTAGVADGFDLDARWDTRAGLAHDFGVRGRLRLAERWAASLSVSHGFFTVEEIGGIEAADAPFGNGLAVTPGLHLSLFRPGGAHVFLGTGVIVRMTRLENEFGTLRREVDPLLESAWLDVGVEWEGDGATTFLRLRSVVPVGADLRVIGYLPWLTIGRTWELR